MTLGILRACYVSWLHQSWCSQLTSHALNIPSVVCVAPPKDEQVTINKLNKKCITLVLLY
jgi:hypothetical protein